MQTIYEYPFQISSLVTIDMPEGAKVLAAEMQGQTPCLWAMVDPAAEYEIRQFTIIGTGGEVPNIADIALKQHISTFQQPPFVWHMFEINGVGTPEQ